MDSKDEIMSELSTVVEKLSLKLASLQDKVNELCKNTDCERVKNVNQDLLQTHRRQRKTKE